MRVLIVPNTDNPAALASAAELASWLAADGHEPAMLPDDAAAASLPDLALPFGTPASPELVVTLGGDGTILRAVHALNGEETPLLGVNLGRLGFLTGADAGEMREAVSAAIAGTAPVDRLATLHAEVTSAEGTAGFRSLNEVFVGRGAGARAVELSIAVNGSPLLRFVCDGLILATATGSTAYALSVGGPVLAPSVRGMLLVPVGAHTLAQRPFVLGPGDVVEVTCPNPHRGDACVTVDGMQQGCAGVQRAVVRMGEHDVPLLRPHGGHFYDVVRRKFLGG